MNETVIQNLFLSVIQKCIFLSFSNVMMAQQNRIIIINSTENLEATYDMTKIL